jgi:hypothetical protein
MTTKDYVALAAALKRGGSSTELDREVARVLADDSELFDPFRFFRACGQPSNLAQSSVILMGKQP